MTVCPAGWRLPDTSDWNDLVIAAGGQRVRVEETEKNVYYYWSVAGGKLRSKAGWVDRDNKPNGNGTDNLRFSALPGGFRYPCDFIYFNLFHNII
jgi:uncharacterized protein (TIGR02145 family)